MDIYTNEIYKRDLFIFSRLERELNGEFDSGVSRHQQKKEIINI